MKSWSVKTKLSALVVFFATALIGLALISLWNLKTCNQRFESTYKDRVIPLQQLKEISDMYAVNIVDTAHKTRDGVLSWQQAASHIEEARQKISEYWTAYLATYLTPEEEKLVAQARIDMQQAEAAVDQLSGLIAQQNLAGLTAFTAKDLYPAIDPLTYAISKLVDLQLSVANADFNASVAAYQNSRLTFLILVVAALLLSVLFATLMIRQLLNELGGEPSQVADIAKAISVGQLDTPIDLRADDSGSMTASCKLMQDKIRKVIGEIVYISGQMSSASQQLAAASAQLSASTQEQNDSTTGMAVAVEQMTASIGQISDNAAAGSVLARNSCDLSQQGEAVIGKAAQGILQIVHRVQTTATEVTRLSDEAETISNIVQVIKDVADQTNLLALNAAIEAARAGEQGRGFAVVADEVRKLAERTTKATVEIGQLITAIQHSAKGAVSSMRQVVEEVRLGAADADSAGQSIAEITGMSVNVMHVVQEISHALSEQSIASNVIAKNVQQVANLAEENGAAANELAESASVLQNMAGRLEQSVAMFT